MPRRKIEEVFAEVMRGKISHREEKVTLASVQRQLDGVLDGRRRKKVFAFSVLPAIGAAGFYYSDNMKEFYRRYFKLPRETVKNLNSFLSFFPAEKPGLFTDIGKLARDVLNLDCNSRRCVVTSVDRSGIVLTHSGWLENRDILAAISCQLKKKGMLDIVGDLKFTTRNTISGLITLTCEEFAPGLKIFIRRTSDPIISNSIALEYTRTYFGLNSSFGLFHNPMLNCAAVLGTSLFSVGGDVSINAVDYIINAWKVGFSFSKDDIIGALMFTNGGNIQATYYRCYHESKFASELNHTVRTRRTNISVGVEHNIDASLIVKASINTLGIVRGMLRIFWYPKCSTMFSAEVNLHRVNEAAGLGFVLEWSI